MVKIHLESLSQEYRKKLCERSLTRETIDSLARETSKQYLLKKRAFKKVAVFCAAILLLMIVLTLVSPSAPLENWKVLAFSFGIVALLETMILAGLYFLAVTRIPRQFAKCLQKGYPELVMEYGYEQIINGSLAEQKHSRQLPFSLGIEDIFRLENSEDVVVVGFAHGLIKKGISVFIIDKNDPSKGRVTALVIGIEKRNQAASSPLPQAAAQAADCHVALRIRMSAEFDLVPGMYLYRELPS